MASLTACLTFNKISNWQVGLLTFLVFVFGLFFIYGVIYVWNLFRAPYRQRNEAIDKVDELVQKIDALEERDNYQRNNPTQFMSTTLDLLVVNKQNTWVSADVVIASRLPFPIDIGTVHAELWFLRADGKRRRCDMETRKGQVCGTVSGEAGKRDLTVGVHVDDKKLSESLRKSVHTCGYGWANVDGKIYITTSDSKELILGLGEKAVLIINPSLSRSFLDKKLSPEIKNEQN
ncbi:MAG: hypothetical protein ABSB38_07800 [Dehalococcoidia bacterium]